MNRNGISPRLVGRLYLAGIMICGFFATQDNAATLPKRGVSYHGGASQTPINNLGLATRYYNWGPNPGVTLPAGSQFIPEIWGLNHMNSAALSAAKAAGTAVLTFNEPNNGGQANMSVQQALDAWPQLEALGLPLGSPACGCDDAGGWTRNFMQGAAQRNYRVDFLCTHFYGDYYGQNGNPQKAADTCIAVMKSLYSRYNKPIWLTEFSLSYSNAASAQNELQFMTLVLPRLEALPFMEAYFWFILNYDPSYSFMCLANSNGSLNSLGTFYKNFVSTSIVPQSPLSADNLCPAYESVTAPVAGLFRMACPWQRPGASLWIVNGQGRTVFSCPAINATSALVDRNSLSSGVYSAIWNGDGRRAITRLMAP